MKIIISPAKKMNIDADFLPPRNAPVYLEKANKLKEYLQALTYEELKKLLCCNDDIAKLNYERYKNMDLCRYTNPAILSYEGIQYKYMAPQVFEDVYFDYLTPDIRYVTCVFGEIVNGKVIEKGVYVKMARGEMVRFMAENAITDLKQIKTFNRLGFAYVEELSNKDTYVFVKV